jgi:hypothetical protein
MANFANGKIYAIRSHLTSEIYIGSTTQPLHKRFHQHKVPSNKTTSIKIIAFGDAYIELIENYPCVDKNELTRREGEIIRNTPNYVNRQIAGRTVPEYREEHKQETLVKSKQYYESHKPEITAKHKQYNETHKIELASKANQYYETHKVEVNTKAKQYYETHKVEVDTKTKQYYETHKSEIKARRQKYRETHKVEISSKRKEYLRLKKIDHLMADLD